MMRVVLIGALLLGWASAATAAEKLVLVAGGEGLFQEPFGLDFTPDGKIVLVDYKGQRVRQIDAAGQVTTVAGTGTKGAADGPGDKAEFNGPHNLVVAPSGDIYVADTLSHLIRKIDGKTHVVSTVAGSTKGFGGDGGPAREAKFDQTFHVAIDSTGTALYVADLSNRRIRKVDLKTGIVSTVAGNGQKAVPKDGATATEAPLVDPRSVAVDKQGRIYILERTGHALRVVENGKIRTVAGTGKPGLSGDGGPGIQAQLNGPKLIWIDPAGDVLIADAENSVIRKYVAKDGTIVRVAGTGKKGASGLGGPPLQAELARPHGVAVSPDGTLYIVDSNNRRVLKVAK